MSHLISTLNEVNASFGGIIGGYHNERLKVLTSAAVQEVKEHGVVYKKDESCAEITNVDTVVIAIGVRANTALEESLTDCDFTIVSVGDCHERAKNGYRGIQEGYKAGILI